MPYQIEFEKAPNHIVATVTGINSREVVTQYMEEILAECRRQDCFSVLIDERLEGPRLGVMDVFSLASEGSMKALGEFEAIAYVDESMGELAQFAETVAVNRGMPIAMFDNVEDAHRWLTRRQTGLEGQDIFRERDMPDED
jgi:hypothetical protein